MKDEKDKKTGNHLLASPGAKRQAAYAERQRAQGRRQRSYWLTEAEAAQVAAFLEQLRAGQKEGEA
jgi:hypothetical protein